MFSQTQSSWILAGWLNGTARPKEDLLLIHGMRLALKGPRNQDQETGESQPYISRFSSKQFHFKFICLHLIAVCLMKFEAID